jgi:hypothetical protein
MTNNQNRNKLKVVKKYRGPKQLYIEIGMAFNVLSQAVFY